MIRRIVVTGGAGYIGSHTVQMLRERGYEVTIVDDLSRGHRETVGDTPFHLLRLQETERLTEVLGETRCEAVIHFASFIEVGESMAMPEVYFENNVGGAISLLSAMARAGVKNLVFSSTAAVYGNPHTSPILEDFPYAAVSAYGETKVTVERMLPFFESAHDVKSVTLRYFNACGADPGARIGENHTPESHLMPLVMRAVRTGRPVTLFGNDYPTPDGTCIRDYIHVNDLAQAHILAVERLGAGGPSNRFNVGTGLGNSVLELVEAVEAVVGREVPRLIGPRRPGDPAHLVANSDKLKSTLGWKPRYTDLREIVETAWRYERGRRGAA